MCRTCQTKWEFVCLCGGSSIIETCWPSLLEHDAVDKKILVVCSSVALLLAANSFWGYLQTQHHQCSTYERMVDHTAVRHACCSFVQVADPVVWLALAFKTRRAGHVTSLQNTDTHRHPVDIITVLKS